MVDVSLDFGMLDGKPVTLRELPLTQYGVAMQACLPGMRQAVGIGAA